MIIQGVLVAVESAIEKCRLVAADAERHRLLRYGSRLLCRCCVLSQNPNEKIIKSINT